MIPVPMLLVSSIEGAHEIRFAVPVDIPRLAMDLLEFPIVTFPGRRHRVRGGLTPWWPVSELSTALGKGHQQVLVSDAPVVRVDRWDQEHDVISPIPIEVGNEVTCPRDIRSQIVLPCVWPREGGACWATEA